MLSDRRFGSVDGLGGGFQVDPRTGQVQAENGAPVTIGAEDPAQLGQQRVEPGVDRGRIGFPPQGLGQLVAGDLAVAVDDQVDEQQPALATWQTASSRSPSRSMTSGPQIWIRTGSVDAKVTPTLWA